MNAMTTIRAWKDKTFRRSLSGAELAALPMNPAGVSFLSDRELELVAGSACGCSPSALCCWNDSSNPSACMSDCGDCTDGEIENRG